MKKLLSIIFGLILIGCLTGCMSTKVEKSEYRTSLSIEVFEVLSPWPNLQRKSLGVVEVPRDGKIEFENPSDNILHFLVTCDVHYDTKVSIGTHARKVELEYFVYEDCEVLKMTEIYGSDYIGNKNRIGKELWHEIQPMIGEKDRTIAFYFLSGMDGAHHAELAKKFYETDPIFENRKEVKF